MTLVPSRWLLSSDNSRMYRFPYVLLVFCQLLLLLTIITSHFKNKTLYISPLTMSLNQLIKQSFFKLNKIQTLGPMCSIERSLTQTYDIVTSYQLQAHFIVATGADGEIGLNAGSFVEHACIHCSSNGYFHVITENPIDSSLKIGTLGFLSAGMYLLNDLLFFQVIYLESYTVTASIQLTITMEFGTKI